MCMCMWAGRWEGMGWGWRMQRAGEGPKGDRGTGGAYRKHDPEALDGVNAGCVEAQRLVERRRLLPSQREGIRGRQHAGWEARECGTVPVRGACGRGSEG